MQQRLSEIFFDHVGRNPQTLGNFRVAEIITVLK
jgi:hypothetical protein